MAAFLKKMLYFCNDLKNNVFFVKFSLESITL